MPGSKARAAIGACTTTSTMFGVRRITSCTTARSSRFKRVTRAVGLGRFGRSAREQPRHHWIALLGAGHGLYDVARVGRMQIAEEADAAAVRTNRREHARRLRLGHALRLHRLAFFVHRLEPLAVQKHVVGIFAAQHRIGLRPCGNQNRLRGQAHGIAGWRSFFRWLGRTDAAPRAAPRHGRSCPLPPASGVRHSANRMPSSSAFHTSS